MKAITIKQPWAWLICSGVKDIENRSWPTKYRGRVLIHASAKPAGLLGNLLTNEQRDIVSLDTQINGFEESSGNSRIIGSVKIVDCVQNHPSIWAEKQGYNWVLASPYLFPEPIPAKGKLSFWDYEGIKSELDEDGQPVCMCNLPVDERAQVMPVLGALECRYCGGKWYR
jgi:hypothetical protein